MLARLLFLCFVLIGVNVFSQGISANVILRQAVVSGSIVDQKATRGIIARNNVNQGSTAYYTAGQFIALEAGFEAKPGSIFQAAIAAVSGDNLGLEETILSLQALPNPFAQQVTLQYKLGKLSRVTHLLLDVQGKVIQQIETGDKPAGIHQMSFKGSELPVGVYIYRIQAGTQTKVLRLLKYH